jgi:hypothetical protein
MERFRQGCQVICMLRSHLHKGFEFDEFRISQNHSVKSNNHFCQVQQATWSLEPKASSEVLKEGEAENKVQLLTLFSRLLLKRFPLGPNPH